MTPVDVGSLPADEVVDLLFEGGALKGLLGNHGAACFALVRPMVAPDFFRRLIDNSATLDATTRQHVAFVVFHGDSSAIVEEGAPYGIDRRPAKIRLEGLSVSDDPWYFNHRDTNPRQPMLAERKQLFSPSLAKQMRYSAASIDDHVLEHHMSQVATELMLLFDIRESSLPCLLFTDGNDFTKWLVVALDERDPLKSLYTDVLKPLSDQFGALSKYWQRRSKLSWSKQSADRAREELAKLPAEIATIEEKVVQERQVAEAKAQPLQAKLAELTLAGNTYMQRIVQVSEAAEVTTLQAELDAIKDGRKQFRSLGHQELETAKLMKRLARAQQRQASRKQQMLLELSQAITTTRNQVEAEFQTLRALEQSKDYKTNQLARAREAAEANSPEKLLLEEQAIQKAEKQLRSRGYSDTVLQAAYPSAFAAIKCMFQQGLLGFRHRVPKVGDKPMRILFLAANPTTTTRLDLEEELHGLEAELRGVKHRDRITLTARHAVRPDDLVRFVRSDSPTIVHFSGHGTGKGIVLRDDTGGYTVVTGPNLQRFFKDRGVELVVLNACCTKPQGKQIARSVSAVVGTKATVGDEAARRFTVAFYRSLGDGCSIRDAFRDGGDAVALHNLKDVFWSSGNLDAVLSGLPASE